MADSKKDDADEEATVKGLLGKLGGLAGIAYCLAGLFLVFLGWNGAATYDRVSAQFPYLISGGLAGLCLVVIGAALLVAQSARADRVALQAAVAELRDALEHSGSGGRGGSAPATGDGDLVLAGASSYHRASCRLVEGQAGVGPVPTSVAVERGLTPCRVCAPDPMSTSTEQGSAAG